MEKLQVQGEPWSLWFTKGPTCAWFSGVAGAISTAKSLGGRKAWLLGCHGEMMWNDLYISIPRSTNSAELIKEDNEAWSGWNRSVILSSIPARNMWYRNPNVDLNPKKEHIINPLIGHWVLECTGKLSKWQQFLEMAAICFPSQMIFFEVIRRRPACSPWASQKYLSSYTPVSQQRHRKSLLKNQKFTLPVATWFYHPQLIAKLRIL